MLKQYWQNLRKNGANSNQLLIPVAIVLALVVGGRWGYGQWQQRLDDIEQTIELHQMQLDKYQRIVANSTNYEKVNRALRTLQMQVHSQRLFDGETVTLAEAKLQNLVKKMAAANNIDIRSTKVLPLQNNDGVKLLHLRVDGKAQIDKISAFLIALRNDSHYLFVPQMEIRVISRREKRFYYITLEIAAIKEV